jgi:prepilin-type N-terminal cleavage/methylation domain-containing protein
MDIRSSANKKQSGFSLVELMVALLIGLLVSLGAYQVFLVSLNSFSRLEKLSRIQESLRFLPDTLAVDIRSADSISREPEAPAEAFSRLVAHFSGRSNDPYCAGGESLNTVAYEFDEDKGAVMISIHCGANEYPDGLNFQEIVRGVVDLDIVPNGNGYSWKVSFGLEPLEGAGDESFEFVVANRRSLVPKFKID